ncbi:AMP-binding protein [Sphingomonas immobilis]|uniref:AMP-binding protein n=1 Tax=Sphingomonas immobilis TaxID=3063997 RepID=A0ABT9A0R2_9SPHN|nr:AMP-binding protein [Sphingomonas sp. CA1-15]MDO7843123.1 AMP-binding protein [Sphingomonas sp. CA1-15]
MAAVMRRNLAARPDKMAVRDEERALTYRQLADAALGLAGAFIGLGLERQQPMLMMLDNHLDFVTTWIGLALTGRVEVPVNTGYRGAILEHVVRNTGARVMMIEQAYVERLAEIGDALDMLDIVIVRGDPTAVTLPGRISVLGVDTLDRAPANIEDVAPWEIMAIMYTSGTTGPSKGAMIPHAQAYGYASPFVWGWASENDTNLACLPLFHITAQWIGIYNALIAGGSAVLLARFSATTFWDKARQYNCTRTNALGAVAQFLFNQPPRADDKDHPIRMMGMSPVIADVEAFKARFGIDKVSTGYGSTEVSAVTIAPPGMAVAGQCGYLRDDYEIRLVDENDVEVEPGQVGEALIRGKEPWSTTAGYVNMPAATAKATRNLWFHTGDLLRLAPNGQYVFCDRNNDAIRRRGENISSYEVEREIETHAAILESAVIKAPSDHSDDEVKACVVVRPGHDLDFAQLVAHLDARMPAFMVPRYYEIFERLPKTPTEKVQKAELRKNSLTAQTWDRTTGATLNV